MTAPATLDRSDVQGNILQPLGHHVAAYVFLEIHDRPAAAAWLARTLPLITTAERRPPRQPKPDVARTLDVTAAGLRALGVPPTVIDSFPSAFLEGMAARAGLLGDTGPSDPSRWQAPQPDRAHLLLTVHTDTLDRHGEEVDRLRADTAASGIEVHHVQPAQPAHVRQGALRVRRRHGPTGPRRGRVAGPGPGLTAVALVATGMAARTGG